MSNLKGLNFASFKRAPVPAPVVLNPHSSEFERVVKSETQLADAELAGAEAIIESIPGGVAVEKSEENIADESEKLSRLVGDDFPFDDTQLAAVSGLIQQQYGCMIGAAGTGKTTVTKKLVDMLRDGLDEVDVSQYWKRGVADDDYEIPERLIPSIVMCSFTGRATQMTKKNFPRDWHPNIMTIHRLLGFYPEFFEAYDEESGMMKKKRRFVPTYDETHKVPWKIIIIDECGMLGLELWHQLLAACPEDTRIYMIGDIQQLPPTHGKSILGFALCSWPTWELTHVHRQQGANNSIVDGAHRVLNGLRPISDSPTELSFRTQEKMIAALNFMVTNQDWRFLNVEIDEDHRKASLRIRQALKMLQNRIYDPNRDVVITPINGFEQTQPGYALGQMPMNQELVVSLNSESRRFFIDAGRERQNFAVGDKVMATVNDYEAGITNGMTGIVTSIEANGGYSFDPRFGPIDEVNDYYAGLPVDDSNDQEFSLEEMMSDAEAGMEEAKAREQRDAGPASHIVTVKFGEDEHSFEIAFGSKSQVASLMLAYVATCHKMQGGEAPLVFSIVHNQHKRPLTREWLYTAITRASQRTVVFATRQGMGIALSKQSIKGKTLDQKIQSFAELTESGPFGPTVKVKLPRKHSLTQELVVHQPREIVREETKPQALGEAESRGPETPAPEPIRQATPRPTVKVGSLHIHIHTAAAKADVAPARVIDGGEISASKAPEPRSSLGLGLRLGTRPNQPLKLPPPATLVSQHGAVRMLQALTEPKLLSLTHQPASIVKPKPAALSLAAMLARQKGLK